MIYSIPNPHWLTDRFIFGKVDDMNCYITLNYEGKIEGIGTDICKRMHNTPIEDIIANNHCEIATEHEQFLFNYIGKEYWYAILERERRENHED